MKIENEASESGKCGKNGKGRADFESKKGCCRGLVPTVSFRTWLATIRTMSWLQIYNRSGEGEEGIGKSEGGKTYNKPRVKSP